MIFSRPCARCAGAGDRYEQAHGPLGPSQDDGGDAPDIGQQRDTHGQLRGADSGMDLVCKFNGKLVLLNFL